MDCLFAQARRGELDEDEEVKPEGGAEGEVKEVKEKKEGEEGSGSESGSSESESDEVNFCYLSNMVNNIMNYSISAY